jgi:hypothetical protein
MSSWRAQGLLYLPLQSIIPAGYNVRTCQAGVTLAPLLKPKTIVTNSRPNQSNHINQSNDINQLYWLTAANIADAIKAILRVRVQPAIVSVEHNLYFSGIKPSYMYMFGLSVICRQAAYEKVKK